MLTLAICVYNAASYLPMTLESVMSQTMQQFRLLIIDDASTDGSPAVIRDFFRLHPREYELVVLPENKGICHARQRALTHAKTKYVLFLDADDLFSPNLVETLVTKIDSDPDLIAVTCWSEFINLKGKKTGGGTYLGVKSKEEFIEKAKKGKRFFMPIHTIFQREYALKAGGFETEGFPEGNPRYQDFCEELDLWTRMSDFYSEGKYFATVPDVLYQYRKSEGLSSNHFNMILKMKYTKTNVKRRRAGKDNLTFVEFMDSLPENELAAIKKEAESADLLRNGYFLLKQGKIFKAMGMLTRSFISNPGYLRDKLKNNLVGRH